MSHFNISLVAFFCCLCSTAVLAQPDNLYIIGGPFNAHKNNWIFRDVIKLEQNNENPHVFYYRGYIGYNMFGDEPGNFKLLTTNNSWDGYHPAGTDNQVIGAAQVGVTLDLRLGGADTKWFVPEDRSGDGYYVINIDTENNTFLIESFTAASSSEFPVGLFLVGGPFIVEASGWSVDESVRMVRDDTNPDIFHFRGYLEHNQWGNEPGSFKILINARDWSDSFHPDGEEDMSMNSIIDNVAHIRHGGSDKKWFLPENGSGNGYWDFSVNTQNMTLAVNNFVHDFEYLEHVYITGDAVPSGWTNSSPEVMLKESNGIYSWRGTISAGEFKFLKFINTWTSCYVAEVENAAVALNHEYDIVYEKNYNKLGNDYKFVIDEDAANKNVEITLNLITNKMTVRDVISSSGILADQQITVSTVQGGVCLSGVADEVYTISVFSVEGRYILQQTFVGDTKISLAKGSYLMKVNQSGQINPAMCRKMIVF